METKDKRLLLKNIAFIQHYLWNVTPDIIAKEKFINKTVYKTINLLTEWYKELYD